MTDYYAVLGLSRSAEADAIATAYRRSALTYNPQCNVDHPDPVELARIFKLVCQAYVILSDGKLRAIYDAYGEDGVRHGGTGSVGVPGGLAVEEIDSNAVFRSFFGVDSPFQVIGDINGVHSNQHHFYSKAAALDRNPPKAPVVNVVLEVSLEDVFYGNLRKVTWTNTWTTSKGDAIKSEASAEFPIPVGIASGDSITLHGKGNTKEGCTQGDVVVTIKLAEHERFRRQGDDLVVTIPISLADALAGASITVNTIENRTLTVFIDEVVHPEFRKVISGEGLRIFNAPAKRGDLIIKCNAKFPAYLTAEQKAEIRRVLDSKQ